MLGIFGFRRLHQSKNRTPMFFYFLALYFFEWMKKYEEAIDLNLRISQEKGELKEDLSVESIRKFILAFNTGLIVMTINFTKEDIDQMKECVEFFLSSIRK